MKRTMLVIVVLLVSFAFGQDMTYSETINDEEFPRGSHTTSGITRTLLKGDVVVVETEIEMPFELEPTKIWHLLEYAEECYADTIRLEKFGDEEYLLMHEHYGEVFTKRQLEKQGYFYQYRWITNTVIDENNPMEFEYIFVKEPTLKGLIKWLENRSNK